MLVALRSQDREEVHTLRLAPVTGRVEERLFGDDGGESLPARVSEALALVVTAPGWEPRALADALTVGDRRTLVRRIVAEVDGPAGWRTSRCDGCGEAFDLRIDVRELPAPASSAPVRSVQLDLTVGPVVVRPLTGADEIAAVAGDDALPLSTRLAARAIGTDEPALTPDDVAAIADALERLGPTPLTSVGTTCPACGAPATASIDPYDAVGRGSTHVLDDVHRLASTYHWSLAEILDLPVQRRREFLRRIDAQRGVRA